MLALLACLLALLPRRLCTHDEWGWMGMSGDEWGWMGWTMDDGWIGCECDAEFETEDGGRREGGSKVSRSRSRFRST